MAASLIFSKKLKPAETRYSSFDGELLAVYLEIKHFQYFLEGHTFRSQASHICLQSPSKSIHTKMISDTWITSLNSQLISATFVELITLLPTPYHELKQNALTQEIPPVFEFIVMAKAQQTNPELKTLLANPQAPTPQIIPCQLYTSDLTILCDTSTRLPRPFVSKSLQKPVSDALHSLSHPGVCATQHSFCLATNQPRCEPVG